MPASVPLLRNVLHARTEYTLRRRHCAVTRRATAPNFWGIGQPCHVACPNVILRTVTSHGYSEKDKQTGPWCCIIIAHKQTHGPFVPDYVYFPSEGAGRGFNPVAGAADEAPVLTPSNCAWKVMTCFSVS